MRNSLKMCERGNDMNFIMAFLLGLNLGYLWWQFYDDSPGWDQDFINYAPDYIIVLNCISIVAYLFIGG